MAFLDLIEQAEVLSVSLGGIPTAPSAVHSLMSLFGSEPTEAFSTRSVEYELAHILPA